jgi:signal transduction histidine kinase/FixJ family two-component response regulator
MQEGANTNILVIDDEEMVRDNIEEILVPRKSHQNAALNQAASLLFNKPQPILEERVSPIPNFSVHKAANGKEGLELIKKGLASGHAYAVIFLDMRMPGWDGLETALQIRKYDKMAEIIFVTAYSDRSIGEIVTQAGQNVGYHCKPYAAEEIIQLATKGVTDYNKLRNLEKLIEVISSIRLDEQQLTSLLQNILDQLVTYVGTNMALLGKLKDDYTYQKIFAIGAVEEKINVERLVNLVKDAHIPYEEVVQVDEVVLVRMHDYTIFAVLRENEKLKTEKLYLLKLYVLNAAKAIQNAELHEKVLQKEKLWAAGNAVGMVMHDLRTPIKSIQTLTNLMREENIQSEWLDLIDQCGVQASEIFEDFLDFVRETPVKKVPVNLSEMIQKAIKSAVTEGEVDSISIRTNMEPELLILGDESKLRRSVINIIKNAVEALRDTKTNHPMIEISAQKDEDGKNVLITIQDNGPGIPPAIVNTLFEPFITRDKSHGTGLGLAIVRQYINAHGGTIKVKNNNGAAFIIGLPCNDKTESHPTEKDATVSVS